MTFISLQAKININNIFHADSGVARGNKGKMDPRLFFCNLFVGLYMCVQDGQGYLILQTAHSKFLQTFIDTLNLTLIGLM